MEEEVSVPIDMLIGGSIESAPRRRTHAPATEYFSGKKPRTKRRRLRVPSCVSNSIECFQLFFLRRETLGSKWDRVMDACMLPFFGLFVFFILCITFWSLVHTRNAVRPVVTFSQAELLEEECVFATLEEFKLAKRNCLSEEELPLVDVFCSSTNECYEWNNYLELEKKMLEKMPFVTSGMVSSTSNMKNVTLPCSVALTAENGTDVFFLFPRIVGTRAPLKTYTVQLKGLDPFVVSVPSTIEIEFKFELRDSSSTFFHAHGNDAVLLHLALADF